jgi:hypothetical protein
MTPNAPEEQVIECVDTPGARSQAEVRGRKDLKLRRWLVSFASGPGWYRVGEFVALDSDAAVERAIEIFGPVAGYQAEEIPWDAAPLYERNRSPR